MTLATGADFPIEKPSPNTRSYSAIGLNSGRLGPLWDSARGTLPKSASSLASVAATPISSDLKRVVP